jgi:hypothetical protein
MSNRALLLPALLAVAGCATSGGDRRSGPAAADRPASSVPEPVAPAPPSDSGAPRLVIPATGGPPVMAIPLGAGQFLPVTGGPPIVGTPVAP